MQAIYDVSAPAKLNLFLHVTGRRADGYHLLQSVFMLIDWSDQLHFEVRRDGALSREDLTWTLPPDDLVLRAARALQSTSGCTLGAHIGVAKSVPAQAGMGGGSSDAASTLLALNRLWNLQLPREKLAQIGLSLGADVPFFLGGENAWIEGVGEKTTPVSLPPSRFLIAKPEEGLETSLIFSDPALQRNTELAIISGFASNVYGFGHNDLQPVAEMHCPAIRQSVDWMATQGLQARMTGSGSAVFAQVNRSVHWQEAPKGVLVKECANLERHPLWGW